MPVTRATSPGDVRLPTQRSSRASAGGTNSVSSVRPPRFTSTNTASGSSKPVRYRNDACCWNVGQ